MFTHTLEKFKSCLEKERRQIDRVDYGNFINSQKDIDYIVKNNFHFFYFSNFQVRLIHLIALKAEQSINELYLHLLIVL